MAIRRVATVIKWMIPVGMGHVGWGFQCGEGVWYYGGLETAGIYIKPGRPNNTNNCRGIFNDMICNMKGTNRPSGGGNAGMYPFHK